MENNFNQNIPVPEEPTQDASQETTAQAAPETAPKPPVKVRRVGTFSLGPVSYTHLDVYKRQGLYYVLDYNQGIWATTGQIEALGWLAVAPVSYTHLRYPWL